MHSVVSNLGELGEDDLILIGVEKRNTTRSNSYEIESLLGLLRPTLYELGQKAHLYSAFPCLTDPNTPIEFLWVHHFPLFEYDQQGRKKASHHPFTAPSTISSLNEMKQVVDVMQLESNSCDLVLNGNEVGGGYEMVRIDK